MVAAAKASERLCIFAIMMPPVCKSPERFRVRSGLMAVVETVAHEATVHVTGARPFLTQLSRGILLTSNMSIARPPQHHRCRSLIRFAGHLTFHARIVDDAASADRGWCSCWRLSKVRSGNSNLR